MKNELSTYWNTQNNLGNGVAVGKETDNVNKLSEDGWQLIQRASFSTDDIAVWKDNKNQYWAVADSHGPWAVLLPKGME